MWIAAIVAMGIALGAAFAGLADAPAPADRFDVVIIDAGHGGEDDGARGVDGTLEKALVLEVSNRLSTEIRRRGFKPVMTRADDTFVPLEERMGIANDARGDLFISIHANSAPNPRVRGTEVFHRSLEASDEAAQELAQRENAAFGAPAVERTQHSDPVLAVLGRLIVDEYEKESGVFAKMAEERLRQAGTMRSRGAKQAPFVVLTDVQMPSALVEIGFITNRADMKVLRTRAVQEEIVNALADAVVEYGHRHDALRGLAAADEEESR
jgi:N-acetylmuramoyl-L-alanine amidase